MTKTLTCGAPVPALYVNVPRRIGLLSLVLQYSVAQLPEREREKERSLCVCVKKRGGGELLSTFLQKTATVHVMSLTPATHFFPKALTCS